MKHFNQNASVIYTDNEGRQIDTFVVFATDIQTGLTRINYQNLSVGLDHLVLHEKTRDYYHMPMEDAFSFEIFRKLREKYQESDLAPKNKVAITTQLQIFAEAS
jgi:hypothetical protein